MILSLFQRILFGDEEWFFDPPTKRMCRRIENRWESRPATEAEEAEYLDHWAW